MKLPDAIFRPAFWLWLCLAAFPPELIAQGMGWDLMNPAYLGLMLVWWPVDVFGRLAVLGMLMGEGGPMGRPYMLPIFKALPTALAAELLLSAKLAPVLLAGLVPGFAWIAWAGLDGPRDWMPALVLGVLGLIPALLFTLRRLLAPILILQGLDRAGQALAASAGVMHGRLRLFLAAALPWLALSWALDLGGLALAEWAGLALAPLSLAASLLGLWRGWQRLA